MALVVGLVVFFVIIGIFRTLLGIPSLKSKSDHYNERDYP